MSLLVIRAACVATALVAAQPAFAVTCDEFLSKVAASSYSKMLPTFELEESPNLPGLFNITNLPNITAAYVCKSGEFDGLGSTLGRGGEADRLRWAALAGATMDAIRPSGSKGDGMEVVSRLQEKAINDAKLEEVKSGLRSGSAEEVYGDFELTINVYSGSIQIQIDRAD